MTYLPDPESVFETWDEPIHADGLKLARRRCKALAKGYTQQSRSNVELINTFKASKQTQTRYICQFRSEIEP